MTALLSILIGFASTPDVAGSKQSTAPDRVARLNAAFLDRVEKHADAAVVQSIREYWEHDYRTADSESFAADALALLNPSYRDALAAFDSGEYDHVLALLDPLRTSDDPFLAANAGYFWIRAKIELGQLEEVELDLESLLSDPSLAQHTVYAPHLVFMRAFCQAANLRHEQAAETLARIQREFPDAPETIAIGARQLAHELDRRERGTLGEVAGIMKYAADRLAVEDATERVRERQDEIIAMLDKLIKQSEQQEKGGGGSGRRSAQRPAAQPKETSEVGRGAGEIGDLHSAPGANPGEMWGKLPPSEREKILQSLRSRFPSRYRQLVEQYYRAMAEEK